MSLYSKQHPIWDNKLYELIGPQSFNSLDISINQQHLASVGHYLDNYLHWELRIQSIIDMQTIHLMDFINDEYIYQIKYAPNGLWLVGCGELNDNSCIRIWELNTYSQLPLKFIGEPEYRLAITNDSTQFITGGYHSNISIWDANSGHKQYNILTKCDNIIQISLSVDSKTIAVAGQFTISILDLQSNKYTYWNDRIIITSIQLSRDNNMVVTAGKGYWIKLWNVQSNKLIRKFRDDSRNVKSIGFSVDQSMIICVNRAITLLDLHTTNVIQQIHQYINHNQPSLLTTNDGKIIITSGRDYKLKLWYSLDS